MTHQDEKLTRVSYTSTMRGDVTAAGRTLESILETTLWCNSNSQVSGQVSYDAPLKQVWQVMEGTPEAVAEVWEKISTDARHNIDFDSVYMEHVDSPRYPKGWGMKYLNFDQGHSILPEADPSAGGLVQVMYKSFVKDNGGMEGKMIEELVPKAEKKNTDLGITSWMLYNDRTMTVYQVLEGPPSAVEKLWNTIRDDPRHDVCLNSVKRRFIEKREFPNWSMTLDQVQQSSWNVGAAY